jgi:hypothetical protein
MVGSPLWPASLESRCFRSSVIKCAAWPSRVPAATWASVAVTSSAARDCLWGGEGASSGSRSPKRRYSSEATPPRSTCPRCCVLLRVVPIGSREPSPSPACTTQAPNRSRLPVTPQPLSGHLRQIRGAAGFPLSLNSLANHALRPGGCLTSTILSH